MDYFNYATGLTMTNKKFSNLFGHKVRDPEKDLLTQFHMDIAASIQEAIEEIILKLCKSIYEETKIKNLCLAGGVALNCVANGKLIKKNGQLYKNFRGMGSIGAMNKGSADRYFQKKYKDASKYVPEGVEGLVKFKGNVENIIYQLTGGLKSSMGYLGSKKIKDLRNKPKFLKITKAGFYESMVHNIDKIKK